jgi:mannose-6-phosphate isomerase-like protein (cupin superfamily)
MASTIETKAEARVVRLEELSWIEAPGHHGALSKLLVNPENSPTKYFDFRISTYTPKGHVEPHSHAVTEQVYYILSGKGVMILGERRIIVEPHTSIFIPPHVVHAIENTGLEDLVFVVVSAPAQEMSRVDTRPST